MMKKDEAVKLYDSKFWVGMSLRDRAMFQLFESRLCMPFDVFHEALEKTLGRPVFTHELGMNLQGLKLEMMGELSPPTMAEIIGLIPADKLLVVGA